MENTSGAVHLTSLSVDISELQKQVDTAGKEMEELAKKATKAGEEIRASLGGGKSSIGGTGLSFGGDSGSIKSSVAAIESLNLAYKNFLVTLSGSKLSDNTLKQIPADAEKAASQMLVLTTEVQKTNTVTAEQAQKYQELSSTLKTLKGQFADIRTEQNNQARQFQEINKAISDTIPKLRTFEKTATFKNSRQEASALKAEFKELAERIKAGGISAQEAQSQLDGLSKRFEEFSAHVNTSNSALQNFVDKISESAKWQVANMLLMSVRQAFSGLTDTIIDTENAVIELRRVLGEKAPSNTAMSDELYNIAYEFGQTFEAVQETAVKFAQTGKDWQETIDATRATMLALNTAELEVSTATEGLIAVIAQFDIQAEDLETVIDKINITADNFPVTSENIVAALQRAGGTASAFGMTIEETIGSITALSKATGRAGANIGTALNSLITFSMKAESLTKFSEFLGEDVSGAGVLELWTKLSEAIHGSGDELATMMSQSEEFADLMDETLATSIGLEEEYNLALKEQNQALKDGKDIYSTVGTYRQNYFIALLKEIQTANDAIDTMNGALGYSQQENITAMEAYSKKLEQLHISLQQLAVDFGNSGALDFAKFLVESATALVKLTGSLGGFNTLLGITSTIILTIKRQKINKMFEDLISPIKAAKTAITTFISSMQTGATATEAMSVAVSGLRISLGDITAILALVFTAFNIGKGVFDTFTGKAKEAIDASISAGKEAADALNTMYEADRRFKEAKTDEERTVAAQELLKTLGFTEDELAKIYDSVEGLANPEEELNRIIKERLDLRYKEYRLTQINAQKSAEKKARSEIDLPTYNPIEILGADLGSWDTIQDKLRESGDAVQYFIGEFSKIKDLEDANSKLEESTKIVNEFEKTYSKAFLKDNPAYNYFKKAQKAEQEYINTAKADVDQVAIANKAYDDYYANFIENEEKAKRAVEEYAKANKDAEDATVDYSKSIEALGKRFDDLSSKIDSFQSSYKTLENVITEYNKTGIMTADMMQTLLSLEPEYIDLLDQEGGKLSVNEEKLRTLMETNADYLLQLQAVKIAKEAEAMASDLQKVALGELTQEEFNAKYMMQQLNDKIAEAAYAFLSGKDDGKKFTKALQDMATQLGLTAEQAGILTGNILGLSNSYKSLMISQNLAKIDKVGGYTKADWYSHLLHGTISKAEYDSAMKEFEKLSMSTNDLKDLFFGDTTTTKGSGGSSTKKTSVDTLNDKAKAAMDSLKEMLAVYEHSIFLIDKNDWGAEKAVAIYREMQAKVHEQADAFREMGFGEDSEYIRELQKLHWGYHDDIIDLYEDMYDEIIGEHENMIDELDYQYSQLEKAQDFSGMTENLQKQVNEQKAIQEAALKEYEQLLKVGVDKNDDAVQSVLKTIRSAADAIQEINDKIKDQVLDAYDSFISAADKFDLWDNLDFTKVDYLQRKMEAINQLFRDGTITLQEYNNQLREMTEAMYDAQVEQFKKQQEETKKYYDDLIKRRKEDIENLKNQKTAQKEYYDNIVDGYKEEIKQWNKRKEEVTDYYDELISALQQVQKDNDRINRQIDYYNSRQKIITNLEQAQARSGVEWREKEMEYQQQLIELDEEWSRTRQEWSIEDQITKLQELKDAALADIDATIESINNSIESVQKQSEAAIESIENEIKSIESVIDDLEKQSEEAIDRIEERIKELSKQIAAAFSSASMNGMLNTAQSINQAFSNAGNTLFGGGTINTSALGGYGNSFASSFVNSAQTAATQALKTLTTNFVNPALPLFGTLGTALGTALTAGIKTGVSNLQQGETAKLLTSSLSSPLRTSINSLMRTSTTSGLAANNIQSVMARGTAAANSATSSLKTSSGNAVIYVTNNVNSVDTAADRTNNIIQNLGI